MITPYKVTNKKNKNSYLVLNDTVYNATNNVNLPRMVLYISTKNPIVYYIREYDEFLEKFIIEE